MNINIKADIFHVVINLQFLFLNGINTDPVNSSSVRERSVNITRDTG